MESTRKDVFIALNEERIYQDTIRKAKEKDKNDDEKSLAEMVIYMEHLLNETKKAIYELNEKKAKALIRKTTAVGVAAMEAFGAERR